MATPGNAPSEWPALAMAQPIGTLLEQMHGVLLGKAR